MPIKSWCEEIEEGALRQAWDLARHPALFHHVALMPDCHRGFGMPIGGVAGCAGAVIPNAVGVDIGCGMCAARTNHASAGVNRARIRAVLSAVKESVPAGEGKAHRAPRDWSGFDEYLAAFLAAAAAVFPDLQVAEEIDIHHNYAARETHFGQWLWVHRKGATAARSGQTGIIPGSMGTPSYIVRGRGNPDSFLSCSHGAGRRLGRLRASRELDRAECDAAMAGIAFDGWSRMHGRRRARTGPWDLSEAPFAYKDIDAVIRAQADLVEPVVKLQPLGVVKG